MGEIADMMLDGILCAGCGVAMDDVMDDDFEEPGYPRYCSRECAPAVMRCEPAKKPRVYAYRDPPSTYKADCPVCGKRLSFNGVDDHVRAKHPEHVSALAKPTGENR